MKIDNSKDSAQMSGKWFNPGSSLYNAIMKESNYQELLNETYLKVEMPIKNNENDRTSYSSSGCKYPHHVIKNGKLILSAPGVKAAYSRAKQMGIYKGSVKSHLDKHMRELGFLNRNGVHYEEVMEDNFRYIESVIDSALGTNLIMMESELAEFDEKSHGNLKYCYRIGYDIHTGTKVAVEFELIPDTINGVGDEALTKNAYKKANGEEITDGRLKEIHSTALDYIKQRIKKTGHIDFTTAALRVNAIFDESHRKYDHVEIIGLFSNAIKQLLSNFFFPKKSDGTIDKELSNNRMNQYSDCATMTVEGREIQVDKLMKKPEIRELVLSNKIQVEPYTVGKISGENRYKSTKLIWNRKQFNSLKLTPVVRGVIPIPQNIKDPTSQKNATDYINNFLNNKYRSTHESVSVDDSFFIMTESPNEDNLVNGITTSDGWFLEQASSSYCRFLSESAVSEYLRSLPYNLMLETAESPHEIIPYFHLIYSNTTNPVFLETLEGSTLDAAILISDWCSTHSLPNCIVEATIHDNDHIYKEGCVLYMQDGKFTIAGRIVSNSVKSRDFQTILENVMGSYTKYFHTKDIDLAIIPGDSEKIDQVAYNYSSLVSDGISGISEMTESVIVEEDNIEELEEWIDTIVTEGWDTLEVFDEKSHGNLKYCYRIGYDIHTGTKVAVEFELDPSKITNVGLSSNIYIADQHNKGNSTNGPIYSYILDKSPRVKDLRSKAIDGLKRSIRRFGYNDFITDDLPVNRIFTQNGKSMNSVTIVPLFSKWIQAALAAFKKNPMDDKGKPMSFADFIVSEAKKNPNSADSKVHEIINTEKYKVSDIPQGKDTYKTTKLIWDRDLMKSYVYTPAIRGYNKPGNYSDDKSLNSKDTKSYIDTNLLGTRIDSYLKKPKNESLDIDDYPPITNYNENSCGTVVVTPERLIVGYDDIELSSEYTPERALMDTITGNFPTTNMTITYFDEDYNLYEFTKDEVDMFINGWKDISETHESTGSEILLPGIHTPSQLLAYMSNINYGWLGKNGEIYKDADDGNFFKDYALQSPSELIKSGYGVCWDQVEFERQWFIDNNYNFRTYFLAIDDNGNKPSHTFLIYQENNKVYWFENSWYDQRGIHVFDSLSEAMREIIDKFNKSYHNKTNDIYLFNLPKMPAGTGCEEFYRIATDSKNLLKHVQASEMIKESIAAETEDSDIEKKWFVKSDDGVDNCCIKVKGYEKPMRGRSAMITLRLDDDKWEVLCKKNADDYGVPGGGWNKGETPEHAAIRELQEETLSNAKNVKRMGTLIEYSDKVKDWVKEHVPNKDDWWYGYYSAVFVGMYDGKFKGKVKAEDRESGYEWKPIDNKLMKQLPKGYQNAINEYINKENPFEESVEEFDEKSHGELKYCYRVGFDIKTGEEVCVQFEIPKGDNEFVTAVGDPGLTNNTYRDLTGVNMPDHMLKKVHTTAVDSVRKTFRKLGHIDFVTKPAMVVSIFTRDHKPLSNVAMVGLFSQRIIDILNKFVRDPSYGKKLIDEYRRKTGDPTSQPPSDQVFSSPLMKEYMKRELALNSDGVEEYKVGQNGGSNKHKTTKLIWDRDIFLSYKYTNALRGFMRDRPAGRGDNKKDQLDMLINGLNNKYHKTPDERNAYKNTIESTVSDEFINDVSMSDGILDLCSMMESMVSIKSIHLGGFEIIANNPNNPHKLICRESYIADPLDLEKIFFENGDDFRDFIITENNEIFTEAENDPPPVEDTEEQKPTSEEEQSAEEDLSNKETDANAQENPNATEPPTVDPASADNAREEPTDGDTQTNDTEPTGDQPDDTEPPQEETPPQAVPQKTPISRPQQFANQEQDKNGVRRKNLYIEFIRWAKAYNSKNIFGSNFDKDIFNGSYPFVPDEMRYFYRLADPTMCILAGGLTFFPVIQLRKLNSENKHLDKFMIFAATNNDMRVFSNIDKRVYMATEQNGDIVLGKPLANTFDMYIQTMIDKGDILNGPREDTTLEYAEDLV